MEKKHVTLWVDMQFTYCTRYEYQRAPTEVCVLSQGLAQEILSHI